MRTQLASFVLLILLATVPAFLISQAERPPRRGTSGKYMKTGHGGANGRYTSLKEIAFDYAFLLKELRML
jgi:hypothetical protein